MFCRNCGKEMQANDKVCSSCGSAVNTGVSFCQQCGAPSNYRDQVCSKCGVKLATSKNLSAKSRIVAGVLGIFLGGFGVHRFYLGYSGIGIIQIIVTILSCGIGYLWGFIEGILILTGNINKDAMGVDLAE